MSYWTWENKWQYRSWMCKGISKQRSLILPSKLPQYMGDALITVPLIGGGWQLCNMRTYWWCNETSTSCSLASMLMEFWACKPLQLTINFFLPLLPWSHFLGEYHNWTFDMITWVIQSEHPLQSLLPSSTPTPPPPLPYFTHAPPLLHPHPSPTSPHPSSTLHLPLPYSTPPLPYFTPPLPYSAPPSPTIHSSLPYFTPTPPLLHLTPPLLYTCPSPTPPHPSPSSPYPSPTLPHPPLLHTHPSPCSPPPPPHTHTPSN